MSQLLKISEAASLALHTMAYLAHFPKQQFTTHDIAGVFDVSEAHLSKVLQRLSKAGLVKSHRGPKGGFRIGRLPESITLLQIFECMEGRIEPNTCVLDGPKCREGACLFGGMLEEINQVVIEHLDKTRLCDLKQMFYAEQSAV